MKRDELKLDTAISFRLDGRWQGEGQIVSVNDDEQAVAVRLTKKCKEFEKGHLIFVFFNESVGPVDLSEAQKYKNKIMKSIKSKLTNEELNCIDFK